MKGGGAIPSEISFGPPLTFMPLLADGEGQRSPIVALAATATGLACSVKIFLLTRTNLTCKTRDVEQLRNLIGQIERRTITAIVQVGVCNTPRLYGGFACWTGVVYPGRGGRNFAGTKTKKCHHKIAFLRDHAAINRRRRLPPPIGGVPWPARCGRPGRVAPASVCF